MSLSQYAARAYAEGVWPPLGSQTVAAGGDAGGPAELESAGSAEEKSLEAGAIDVVSATDAAPSAKASLHCFMLLGMQTKDPTADPRAGTRLI